MKNAPFRKKLFNRKSAKDGAPTLPSKLPTQTSPTLPHGFSYHSIALRDRHIAELVDFEARRGIPVEKSLDEAIGLLFAKRQRELQCVGV